ncbi:MAG: hypothetical protein ACHQNT_04820 [Bacteroidia bacterium]
MGHTPGPYIHDGYVRNDTLWAAHIYAGYVGVYNVSNKANPVLLATQNTTNNFPHNTWLSTSGRALFTTDEVSNSYLTSYDVSDVTNIFELDRIKAPVSTLLKSIILVAFDSYYQAYISIEQPARAS